MDEQEFHRDVHERAAARRWHPYEERMQLSSELALVGAEARDYDTLLELAARLIALHGNGGCVIGLLADDGTLYPIALYHPDPDAHDALGELTGQGFAPLAGLEDKVLAEGRGRLTPARPELFVERPGVARYLEITGHTSAAVVPMRVRNRSVGVLWLSAERQLEQDDVNFLEMVASRLALAVDHARLVEGDVDPARPVEAGPAAALTRREREILGLLGAGMTSREVAERLVVSVRTVEWHRSRMQQKLGVSGRAELTRIARAAGLVPDLP